MHGIKALVQERKESKLRKLELLSKVEKVALFVEKGKGKKKTFDEHCEKLEKEIEELSSLEDEASRPAKKEESHNEKEGLESAI
uniref:Protein MNN4-like n=1 Tax=Cucumis melo TaxID=3656 RepID=A0A9I9D4D1_CUCME